MTYALYVYTDNAGNDWSVSVPVDVATALSMVAATTQPYLDETIAPRFANFRSAAGLIRQAVIKNRTQFGAAVGMVIVLGGVNYTGVSARGETVGAIQPALVQPPMALMGPPGASGLSPNFYQQNLNATTNIGAGFATILTISSIAKGTYLLIGELSVVNNDTAEHEFWSFISDGSGPVGQFSYGTVPGGQNATIPIIDVFVEVGGGGNIQLAAAADANGVLQAMGAAVPGTSYSTRFLATQIA